jgi:outer membrane protein assembly factor BamB
MKSLLTVAAALALTATTAWTQPEPVRLFTDPRVPPRDAYERLSLTLGWSLRLKTDGLKDGLFSVQMIPDPGKQRLIVQTLRGDVIALDAETGDPLWRTHVGEPYWLARPVGFNSQAIFTTRRNKLFVLDRQTGKQLLWTVEKDSGLPIWGTTLEGVPSAGPTADDEMLFVCLENRVSGYFVPDFRTLSRLRAKEQAEEARKRAPSPQVRREWTQGLDPLQLAQPAMLAGDNVAVIATNGTFLLLNKLEGHEGYRYQVEKAVAAPAANTRNHAYVGSLDFQLYDFDLFRGRLGWRYTATAPIALPVEATDRDVYVSPERLGLVRVDRATGTHVWTARDAERFLATNGKFVYAFDRFGNLLVLDYDRGTQLAKWDTRDFVFPVPNAWTDRLYLAAHNGLIVCLHHRDYPSPLKIKTPPSEQPTKTPPKKDGGKKGGGKKDGGKKDDGKIEEKKEQKKEEKKEDEKEDKGEAVKMGAAPQARPGLAELAGHLRGERAAVVAPARAPLVYRRPEHATVCGEGEAPAEPALACAPRRGLRPPAREGPL